MVKVRLGRVALLALAWSGALVFAWLSVALVTTSLGLGVDSHAYWAAWRGPMYDHAPATRDAYLYSPAFAQVLWPLAQLPWHVFGVLWSLAATVAVLWLAAGAGRRWMGPLALLGTFEVLTGNVNWLLALVAVLGMRRPGAWAVVALTKVTPLTGPLWFLVRREWRGLAVAVGCTCAVTALSVATAPGLWQDWVAFLAEHAGSSTGQVGSSLMPPLPVRALAAAALVVWGARTDRVWVVPVGMALLSPVSGVGQLVVLLAIPRMVRGSRPPASAAPAVSSRRDLAR